MLKIKDNIDLKELEKFGFKPETKNKKVIGYENNYFNIYTENGKGHTKLELNLHMGGCLNTRPALDGIWDLIKADLVEKVKG